MPAPEGWSTEATDRFDALTWRRMNLSFRESLVMVAVIGAVAFVAFGARGVVPGIVIAASLCAFGNGVESYRGALRARTDWGVGLRLLLYLAGIATLVVPIGVLLVTSARRAGNR